MYTQHTCIPKTVPREYTVAKTSIILFVSSPRKTVAEKHTQEECFDDCSEFDTHNQKEIMNENTLKTATRYCIPTRIGGKLIKQIMCIKNLKANIGVKQEVTLIVFYSLVSTFKS